MQTNDQTETEVAETNRLAGNTEHEAKEFREIAVESPQPPWHLKIEPPVEFDGEKYKELVFDFDAMIGKDFVRAERTFTRIYKPDKNETAVLPEMKHEYQCVLAAQVADVPIGVIYKLPRRYYIPLRLQVLKACGSSPDEDKA
jgi:hypothetical protein